jgi:hypothetical protein
MIDVLKISLTAYMFSALAQDDRTLFSWYGRLVDRLPWYLCKPLGGCYRCFVGQVCFWYFLFDGQRPLEILFLTSLGIMVSMIYNAIYCCLK